MRIEKGHADAIKALSVLHKQHCIYAHLLFVGNGDDQFIDSLKKMAIQYSVEKYIHFSGIQSDVREYYLSSTIFTLTSHSIETFSLAALEAMSFSLPCSLTDIGGASEMIQDGINGTLSKANDHLSIAASWNKLLTTTYDKKTIRNLVLKNFTSAGMVDQYIKLLEKNTLFYN